MNSNDPRILRFTVNNPQGRALTVMANDMVILAGRGSGKTFGIIAPWILHKVAEMPRSSGGLICKSFSDGEKKYLKPITEAFGMLGHTKDLDYVYGKAPPESWDKPYIPVIDYTYVMSFPNGTTMDLVSLHNKGSANSLSLQWIAGDEAKYLDETQLTEEVFPILRGNARYFGNSAWYGAKLLVSDKLSPKIHWLLAKKKLMDVELVDVIIFYQVQLNEQIMKIEGAADASKPALMRKITKLSKLLAELRKKCLYYGEAKALDNIENLRPGFFENMRRSLPDFVYRVSIDNEDPRRVENCFYGSRTDKHTYTSDIDEDIFAPIAIALDYQASISPIVSCQLSDRVIPFTQSLNFIKDFYVKQPLGRQHVINDFCEYHKHRPCKDVIYFYDHTAVGTQNGHKRFWEEVVDWFTEAGWNVTPVYMSGAPGHNVKYSRINSYLENDGVEGYPIRINQSGCEVMLLSMDQTATKETEEGTKKDKTPERNKLIPQEQTTHFSDTFDQLVWAINELKLYPQSVHVVMQVGVR